MKAQTEPKASVGAVISNAGSSASGLVSFSLLLKTREMCSQSLFKLESRNQPRTFILRIFHLKCINPHLYLGRLT